MRFIIFSVVFGGPGVASDGSASRDALVRDLLLRLLRAVSQQQCLGGSGVQVASLLQVWSQATGGQRDTNGTSISVGRPATTVSGSVSAVSAGATVAFGETPVEKQKEIDEVCLANAARGEVFVCFEDPLGAHLKQKVKEKIWRDEFVEIFSLLPLEKFKLDRRKPDKSKKEEEEKRRYRLIPHTFSH